MRNTIKGSVYEYYENNVIKGTLSHADFIKNFGKNAESVLGKADYKISCGSDSKLQILEVIGCIINSID